MSEHDLKNPDYEQGSPDVGAVHAAASREKADPTVRPGALPIWIFVVCLAIAGVASAVYTSGVKDSKSYALVDMRPSDEGGGIVRSLEEQLFEDGKGVYKTNCGGCHMATGAGVPGQYPPLAGSEWVTQGSERLARIVMHGVVGKIKVSGTTYDFPGGMPAQGIALNDKKMAAVLTYIRRESKWGNDASVVYPTQVTAMRAQYEGRLAQWTVDELEKEVPDAMKDFDPVDPAEAAAAAAAGGEVSAAEPAGPEIPEDADPLTAAKIRGEAVYMRTCFSCHQTNGKGLPNLAPSLVGSDWLLGKPDRVVAIIRNGLMGDIMINGKKYETAVPIPMAPVAIEADDMADVITYVRNAWGNEGELVTPEEVEAVLEKYKDRSGFWTAPELDKEFGELLGK